MVFWLQGGHDFVADRRTDGRAFRVTGAFRKRIRLYSVKYALLAPNQPHNIQG